MSNIPSISLWCPPTYQTYLGTVCDALKGTLDLQVHVHEGKDFASIDTAFADAPERPVVVFYESLADALSRAMGHLSTPDATAATGENRPRIMAALEEWIANNAALTALFYRHRTGITLLPALGLLHAPDSVRDLLATRFGDTDVPAASNTTLAVQDLLPSGVDPKFALMASAILQTATEAQEAQDGIDAISTPLDGLDSQFLASSDILGEFLVTPEPPPEAATKDTQPEPDPAQTALIAEQHALELRRLQARHEQDLAALRRQSDAVQMRLLDAVAQQTQLSDLAEQKQAEIAALRATEGSRLEQERVVFEGLIKNYEEAHAQLEQRIAKQKADITALALDVQNRDRAVTDAQNLYDGLVASTSWRITRPMRVIVRGVRRVLGR